jgi:hypothetical protein
LTNSGYPCNAGEFRPTLPRAYHKAIEMNIGLDMMGGDFAPLEAVKGVADF